MKTKILLVDDEQNIVRSLGLTLKHQYEIREAFSIEAAKNLLYTEEIDVIVTDLNFHGQPEDGLDLINWLNEKRVSTPVIILSGEMDVKRVLSAQRRISDDFLVKPVEIPDLVCAIEKSKNRTATHSESKSLPHFYKVLSQDPRIHASMEDIKNLIQSDSKLCICLYGESGTGKEELAKFASSVRRGPFVAVNMAALPTNLEASELFGHLKGGFTGATSDKIGKFQAANGGVLFLDEIGDCPLDLQVKLFRALQEREITRVGSNSPEKIDVKIVVATNLNLKKLVSEGKFREELLWRIEGVKVQIPPLRSRQGDIPLLVGKFIQELSPKARPASITPGALKMLEAYSWPGNVRELKTVIEKALLKSNLKEIDLHHLAPEVLGQAINSFESVATTLDTVHEYNLDHVLKTAEVVVFKKAMAKAKGSRKVAMGLLGITESKFFRRARELGILSNCGTATE